MDHDQQGGGQRYRHAVQDVEPVQCHLAHASSAQERELRIRKLYGQVDNLSTTYDLNRQRLEREAGVEAPSTVDTTAAAEKLRNFVVLTPATESASDIGSIKTIPARTVLLDTRPAP